MPYIKEEDRKLYTYTGNPTTVGDLNYLISTIIDDYIGRYGQSYANLNAVIGVLECAKLECYRRIAAPYEDTKIIANGDVYSTLIKSSPSIQDSFNTESPPMGAPV